MFHKEGQKIILGTLFFVGGSFLVLDNIIELQWLIKLLQLSLLAVLVLILQFFRNPKRHTQKNDARVISPVDGKVVVIEEVEETEYFKEKRLQVSIFMSPLNVHVTRYPIGGSVLFSKYHPGKYLVAWHPKASTENERQKLIGLDVNIKQQELLGRTLFLVQSGPYTSSSILQEAEQLLKANNIPSLRMTIQ